MSILPSIYQIVCHLTPFCCRSAPERLPQSRRTRRQRHSASAGFCLRSSGSSRCTTNRTLGISRPLLVFPHPCPPSFFWASDGAGIVALAPFAIRSASQSRSSVLDPDLSEIKTSVSHHLAIRLCSGVPGFLTNLAIWSTSLPSLAKTLRSKRCTLQFNSLAPYAAVKRKPG